MCTKACDPAPLRKHPETFCCTRDHAQIALRQIVFKIHAVDCQEEQNRPLVFAQPIQQIAGGTLFAAHADAADLLQ
jgi:hypothetical protein